MEYHGLVGELDQRLRSAQRQRTQTCAVTADQYKSFGLGHLGGFNVAHQQRIEDITRPVASERCGFRLTLVAHDLDGQRRDGVTYQMQPVPEDERCFLKRVRSIVCDISYR